MRLLFAGLLLSSSVPLAAQAEKPDDPDAIIITGRSLGDTERALAACLAQKCPPDRDIDASLAHAENLFVAGAYKQARATTKASLVRNRRHAARFPLPVADLERANGRVAAHLGEGYDYQYSTFGIKRALKQGIPQNDPRMIGADLEIAAMLVATGRSQLARHTYAAAERDALKIGRRDLAATARLRSAWIDELEEDRISARRKLKLIAASTDVMERLPRIAAMVLLARLDRRDGSPAGSEQLIAELAAANLRQPFLIYAPKIELVQKNNFKAAQYLTISPMSDLMNMPTDTFEDKWIDVGFWVLPSGRVSELEVLRKSGETGWAEPLLRSVAGRIYAPSEANGVDGTYRVERYSYTSMWEARTGSRIRQREADARIEFLDLTAVPPAGKVADPSPTR